MEKRNLTKVSIALIVISVIFLPPFVKYQRLRYKNSVMDNRIRALKEESKRLEEEKSRLQTDITYIESKARENIGLVRKGEIILREVPPAKRK